MIKLYIKAKRTSDFLKNQRLEKIRKNMQNFNIDIKVEKNYIKIFKK